MLIRLRQGIEVCDPVGTIIDYYKKAGKGTIAYDKFELPPDNSFSKDQIEQVIKVCNRLGARIPYNDKSKVIEPLLQKREEIEYQLTEVPAHLTIFDNYAEIPWDSLKSLFDTSRMKYINLARMTKILHKKRPNLIPILDKNILVNKFLKPLLQNQGIFAWDDTKTAVHYIKVLKKEVDTNRETFMKVQHTLKDIGHDISVLRILDILVWYHFFYKEGHAQNI
jgi:hypothetical protein